MNMDEEAIRELLRRQQEQERRNEAVNRQILQQQAQQQQLQQQPQQSRDSHSMLQALNPGGLGISQQALNQGGLGLSQQAAALLSRARSPVEAPSPAAAALDQFISSQRGSSLRTSSLLSSATNAANPFASALRPSSASALSGTRSDLSSDAISREIKRLQDLQEQLALTTNTSATNPFLYSSQQSATPPSASALTDPNSALLQQYLMQKAQLPTLGTQQGSRGSLLGSSLTATGGLHNRRASLNEAPNQSLLESQLLQEARMLMRRQSVPATTFAAAASAKTPAPLPAMPSPSPHQYTEGTRKMRGGVIEPFPEKLHRLLLEVELLGRSDVISFISEGRAFAIHKSEVFFREIVPLYFRQSRLSSFKRQLNLYGFELINTGPSRGAYYHELFQRDRPELCRRMRRVAVKVAAKPSAKAVDDAKDDDESESSSSSEEEDKKPAANVQEEQKGDGGVAQS